LFHENLTIANSIKNTHTANKTNSATTAIFKNHFRFTFCSFPTIFNIRNPHTTGKEAKKQQNIIQQNSPVKEAIYFPSFYFFT